MKTEEDFRFAVEVKVQDASGKVGGVGRVFHMSGADLEKLSGEDVAEKLKEGYEFSRKNMLDLLKKAQGS